MANQLIRESASSAGVKLWQIADKLGMTDGNFSRKLRKEFPEAERNRILGIITEIAEEAREC